MNVVRKLLPGLLGIIMLPVLYGGLALLLSSFTVNNSGDNSMDSELIYLASNGVHLDIVLPIENLESELLQGLRRHTTDNYLAFGWGDENFYRNTPEWPDLTFSTAFGALFLKQPSAMHITRYRYVMSHWIAVPLSRQELKRVNDVILSSFSVDNLGNKQLLPAAGYTHSDDFYQARGSFSCFKTCNTWVNTVFKKSGLKACLWTPFDFGLLNKYR